MLKARSDQEIESCFLLMHQLRPHLTKEAFLSQVKRQMDCSQLHLDTGTKRHRAHRFYFSAGMEFHCLHLQKDL